MICPSGRVVVVDIGAAFAMRKPPDRVRMTPSYAPPEVLKGERSTPQGDLASLGYVLLELLTGRRLFAGLETISELLDHKQRLPDKIRDILVFATEDLWQFIHRMVAADPCERFSSANEADTHHISGARLLLNRYRRWCLGNPREELDEWIQTLSRSEDGLKSLHSSVRPNDADVGPEGSRPGSL